MPMDHSQSLTGLFRELVHTAVTAQEVAPSAAVQSYLVHVLEAFVRPDRADLLDPPLALDFLAADHLPARQRFDKLKRVGDTALFVTGMFADSLERRPVGASYYTALGRTAFARLSHALPGIDTGNLFEELAERFPECVGVLMEVSERDVFQREQDTVRLYRRWEQTGGRREARLLAQRGLVPVAQSTRHRH
jgi:hypothetical protein